MKSFLLTAFVIIVAISAAVYGFRFWQNYVVKKGQPPIVIQSTLEGVLQPSLSVGEYSDVIETGKLTIGVTSNTINLKQYENKRVRIIGNYLDGVMYADSITILQ